MGGGRAYAALNESGAQELPGPWEVTAGACLATRSNKASRPLRLDKSLDPMRSLRLARRLVILSPTVPARGPDRRT